MIQLSSLFREWTRIAAWKQTIDQIPKNNNQYAGAANA